MQPSRKQDRIAVDIPVTVTTVLAFQPATIVDLTEFGARIDGAALSPGERCQVEVDGHSVFAVVRWAEIDRMGVYFPFGIGGSPLERALETARIVPARGIPMPGPGAAQMGMRGFGRRGN
jgi:hypothetical protein